MEYEDDVPELDLRKNLAADATWVFASSDAGVLYRQLKKIADKLPGRQF